MPEPNRQGRPSLTSEIARALCDLENVLREVGVVGQIAQTILHHRGIHPDLHGALVRSVETQLFQQLLHQGLKPPGTDIRTALVDLGREVRHARKCVGLELDLNLLCREQGLVLLRERVGRLGQDPQ